MNAAATFRHELETTGPHLAPAGRLVLRGWCASTASPQPPQIRLVCGATVLTLSARHDRPDVAAALALPDSARACGFEFAGTVPPGAHLARLEASIDGTGWHCLRRFLLASTSDTLHGAIEYPIGPVVGESVRIQGWCAHPHTALASLELHYGNRRTACEFGLPRSDVAALVPSSPDAARAGFISVKNIPVGHGPLRLCARDTAGRLHFLTTDRRIDIRTDEENPLPLDLSVPAARLGPRHPAGAAAAPAPADRPRRILFVLYGDMTSNSALHVAALAEQLIARGHQCVVAVPRDADTLRYHPGARFRCATYAECGERAALFADGAAPDIVHAWTTAERVRRFSLAICASTGAQLVVHLEDNEGAIFETTTGHTAAELVALPPAELDALVGDDHSHPRRRGEFLARTAGCTLILDRLDELLPPGKPARILWPAAAPEFFERPIPWELREALGWDRDHTVLFYHGNLHPTNRAEMAELHEAVVALNLAGTPTTLLRAGRDFCALPGDLAARAAPHIVALGRIDNHAHLAPLLALADIFVQPGSPDSFNNYRFPSKLPEFFATGRPVILPRTNLGAVVRHGVEAFVLDQADAAGIAAAVRTIHADPSLAARLAVGAAAFAREHFSWDRSAESLATFYDVIAPTPAGNTE